MIKILLVADLKGWIFERHCNEIKKRLSHKYQLDIVYSRPHGRKLAKISKDYDIVYILDPMPLSYPPKEKVILFQHNIIDTEENIEIYRFWTHFFSQTDVLKILEQHKFEKVEFHEDILPESDLWNGDNVIFAKCEKL